MGKVAGDRHTRFLLDYNARRLAVVDRDADAIIVTHARDRKVAAWLHETAQALAEIDRVDLAIDWAKQAADFDCGHQSLTAAGYFSHAFRIGLSRDRHHRAAHPP